MGLEGQVPADRVDGFAGRVEIIEGPSGRRSWPDEVKARIVRESLESGARVSEVARRHRMPPQQLTLWRRAAREGRLSLSERCDDEAGETPFVPLAIVAEQAEPVSTASNGIVIERNGIAIKLPAQTAAKRIAEIVIALDARR
jgi:transposase